MVRSEVYRPSTGLIPNSGAVLRPVSQFFFLNQFETTCSPMLSKISLLDLSRTTLSILGHQVPLCVCLFTSLGHLTQPCIGRALHIMR